MLELGKLVQKNLAGIESAHTEAGRAQQEIQRVAYCRIVVDIDVLTLRHRSDLWRARQGKAERSAGAARLFPPTHPVENGYFNHGICGFVF